MNSEAVLTAVNLIAVVSVAVLIAVKVRMRLWRDADERSVMAIVVSIFGALCIGLAVRFGLPRGLLWTQLVEAFYVAIAVSAAWRVQYHLRAKLEPPPPVPHVHDPVALDAAVSQIQDLLDGVAHLEPCPNPDCVRVRKEMSILAGQLRQHR